MDPILTIIIVIVISLIVLAILLKILGKFPFLNYIVLLGVAIAMIVVGFTGNVPANESEFNGYLMVVEGTLLFAYMIFGYADIAFDRHEYYETTATYHEWSDTVHVETRLQSASNFWSCLGISALGGYGLNFFLHGVFKSAAGSTIMGIIGIVATVWSAIRVASFIAGYVKAKRSAKEYY